MKSLSAKLGVILIGLAIFACVNGWKLLDTKKEGVTYYSPTSIARLPKNIVRVQGRMELSIEGREKMALAFGGRYKNVSYFMFRKEFDCGERKVRLLSEDLYSANGSVIDRMIGRPNQFTPIDPETSDYQLYKAVCK